MEAELLLFKSQCLASTHSCTNRRGDDKDEGRQIDQLKVCHGALLRLKKILFLTHGRGRREYVHVLPPAGSGTPLSSTWEYKRHTGSHKSRKSSQPPRSRQSSSVWTHLYSSSSLFAVCVCAPPVCSLHRALFSAVCRRPVILYQSRAGQSRVWLYIIAPLQLGSIDRHTSERWKIECALTTITKCCACVCGSFKKKKQARILYSGP